MREKAKQMGYSLDDLVKPGKTGGAVTPEGTSPKPKARAAAAPKYRSKKDPSLTWSGRGRPPAWIKEAREKGIDIETMRIHD
ncbi:H-NS histone family protein [Roseovarius aquimarinus]|uniref:H-NS histone family protein n=1 Tax=Roseovarius aquimarinus TaxID=1229156 RepID=UPI00362798C5